MKLHTIFLVAVAIVCIGLGFPANSQGGRPAPAVQMKKVVIDHRWHLTFKLYNGKDCNGSKLQVNWKDLLEGKEWDGSSVSCNATVEITWQSPSGIEREEEIAIPGYAGMPEKHTYERTICVEGEEEGTGTLKVTANDREVFYTEFEFQNGYIRFGSIN
jgi:hypothetical protein